MCIPNLNPFTELMEASLLVENKDEEEEPYQSRTQQSCVGHLAGWVQGLDGLLRGA